MWNAADADVVAQTAAGTQPVHTPVQPGCWLPAEQNTVAAGCGKPAAAAETADSSVEPAALAEASAAFSEPAGQVAELVVKPATEFAAFVGRAAGMVAELADWVTIEQINITADGHHHYNNNLGPDKNVNQIIW
jgi:hypothetical protein